jgi:transcription initiation factor IIE alpha subunit
MTEQHVDATEPQIAAPGTAKPESKATIVTKLLTRTKGATLDEMINATGWQPHSVRAFLSGLRKKGHALVKEQRRSGEQAYRMGAPSKDA